MSKCQTKLMKMIEDLGLDVVEEYPVGPYKIDIYCHTFKLGFEADGKFYHGWKRDERRDKWILDNFGIPILRIKDTEILDSKKVEATRNKILEFIHENVKE